MPRLNSATCLIFTLVIIFANLSARAQNANGVATLNGGRTVVFLKTPRITAHSGEPGKLVKIYSTLGKGDDVYNANAGVGILGTDAGQPWPEKVGNGFRPSADHIVTQIRVAASYVSGTNTLIVSLHQDNHGVPGKTLHSWHFANLPDFGTCCALQTGKSKQGIPVKKGRLYWVVLRTSLKTPDTYDVWNNDASGLEGTFANDIGDGWDPSFQQLGGFGVFGK